MRHEKIFFFLALLILPAAAPARDEWRRLETPHVRVLAHASETTARRIALELERMRRSLLAVVGAPVAERPVHVLVFASRKEFEPFSPIFEGQPGAVPGYSLVGPQRSYILLADDTGKDSLVRHEYAHVFLNQRYSHLPAWLDEGLAEFFSSLRSTQRESWLGEIPPRHLERLRRGPWLPLNVLFSVTPESPLYGDEASRELFYAQACALTHFLLLGDATPQFKKLGELAQALARGTAATEAIASVFGVPAEQLESALTAHVRRSMWPRVHLALLESPPPSASSDAPGEPEILFHLADVFAQAKRFQEARERFAQAAAQFPGFAPFHEELGWLALWQEDGVAAEQEFARAIAAGSQDPEIHYLHAELVLEQKPELRERESPAPESLVGVRADLRHTIALKPDHARAHGLLGFTLLITRAEIDEAIAELERAVSLDPTAAIYRIHLAQAYIGKQDWARARATLEQALAVATDAGARASIEQMLHYISNVTVQR